MTTEGTARRQTLPHPTLSRRRILRQAGLAALGSSTLLSTYGANAVGANSASLTNVALPPDIGQADVQVFVEETGHTLRGSMLDYWRANGAASVFGNPISEPFAASNGLYSQAFENVVMQYREEFLYTHDPIMRLLPLGQMALDREIGEVFRGWFERDSGDAHRRQLREALMPRANTDPAVQSIISEGGTFVAETGHTISEEILSWYRMNEGGFYFGAPLTEP
ncbi:MAG: hypothetical protein AB7V46_20035, partial [Thermomicrobiales bacterium]